MNCCCDRLCGDLWGDCIVQVLHCCKPAGMCVWCRRPTRRQTISSVVSLPKSKVLPSPTHLTWTPDYGMWLTMLSLLRYLNTHTNLISPLCPDLLSVVWAIWPGNGAKLIHCVFYYCMTSSLSLPSDMRAALLTTRVTIPSLWWRIWLSLQNKLSHVVLRWGLDVTWCPIILRQFKYECSLSIHNISLEFRLSFNVYLSGFQIVSIFIPH